MDRKATVRDRFLNFDGLKDVVAEPFWHVVHAKSGNSSGKWFNQPLSSHAFTRKALHFEGGLVGKLADEQLRYRRIENVNWRNVNEALE